MFPLIVNYRQRKSRDLAIVTINGQDVYLLVNPLHFGST
jgi:hypothetical protein